MVSYLLWTMFVLIFILVAEMVFSYIIKSHKGESVLLILGFGLASIGCLLVGLSKLALACSIHIVPEQEAMVAVLIGINEFIAILLIGASAGGFKKMVVQLRRWRANTRWLALNKQFPR
jgi:hypothetical protein